MKLLANIARIVTGGIFIFSGLIKLNDPVGTKIKLEEYFDVFSQDFSFMAGFWHALVPFALYFSILLCSLEVILGVALLVRYQIKKTAWVLLALCTFFAFLTFYSAYYNKVTDCGCFGETIKLEPWTSFWKDIFLMVLIAIILWQIKLFTNAKTGLMVGITTALCLFLGVYAYRHLPPYDGLPYKVGDNIRDNMQPSDSLKFKYIYTMTKGGKDFTFEEYPKDTTYKYKAMETVLLNPEAKPKITDYSVWNNSGTYTDSTFVGKKLFLIIGDIHHANPEAIPALKALADAMQGTGVSTQILTSTSENEFLAFKQKNGLQAVPHYFADVKILKTLCRSNPGVWLLNNGTVKGKWHYNDTPSKEEILGRL